MQLINKTFELEVKWKVQLVNNFITNNNNSKFILIFHRIFLLFVLRVLNPISEQQIFYQYSGSGEPDDVMLYIDYGAIDAYNIAQQSPENLTSGQFLGNFNISEPQFSTVPSPFTQVMTGQDISFRPGEFQQRTQDNIHDFGEQSYSNYQTTTTDYGNKINYAPLYSDTTHEVANILQQSRLGNFG